MYLFFNSPVLVKSFFGGKYFMAANVDFLTENDIVGLSLHQCWGLSS